MRGLREERRLRLRDVQWNWRGVEPRSSAAIYEGFIRTVAIRQISTLYRSQSAAEGRSELNFSRLKWLRSCASWLKSGGWVKCQLYHSRDIPNTHVQNRFSLPLTLSTCILFKELYGCQLLSIKKWNPFLGIRDPITPKLTQLIKALIQALDYEKFVHSVA